MSYILTQLLSAWGGQVLAARKSDEDGGWMQILVFVILAIFYALGSIVKAKANKGAAGKKPTSGKPARKSSEDFVDLKMLKQFFGLPEEPESSNQPIPEESEPQVAKLQVWPSDRKVARPAMPQVQTKIEKVPELTAATPQVEAVLPAEIPQTEYLAGILSDYDDPEKLRRVILHYEILGKPISLRDPSGQIF